jgi:hypothetical protein
VPHTLTLKPLAGSLLFAAALGSFACSKEEPPKSLPAPPSPQSAAYVTASEQIKVTYRLLEGPKSMPIGTEATFRFEATNAGSGTWPAGGSRPLKFGYHWSDPVHTGSWNSIVWDDLHRAVLAVDTPPGAMATFTLKVKTPAKAGNGFKLIIAPLLEGPGGGWTMNTPLVLDVDLK